MNKAIIIGSPGAGKSTFARQLRDATGLPLYYLDMLWHRPDKTNATAQEFDAQVNALIRQGAWIIDGNYLRTLEARMKACDTVFLMDYPLDICLAGAQARVGAQREDLPWVETEFDAEFKRWIEDFSMHQLPPIYRLIELYRKDREIVIFQSREQANDYLRRLNP